MRFREIQGLKYDDPLDKLVSNGFLVTARDSEEYFEIFGMTEMLLKCQELSVDRGAMARFFIAAGRELYKSREGSDCVVEYDHSIDLIEHRATPYVSRIAIQDPMANVVEYDQAINSLDSTEHGATPDASRINVQGRMANYGATMDIGVQVDSHADCTMQLPCGRTMSDTEVQTDMLVQDDVAMDYSQPQHSETAVESDSTDSRFLHEQMNEDINVCLFVVLFA